MVGTESLDHGDNYKLDSLKAIDIGITCVRESGQYEFYKWMDIPFPQGFNNLNCYVFHSYLDQDDDKFIYVKFNPDNTKYLLQNKVAGDVSWTIIFLFIKIN